ncbi:arsenite efflux transporter metallochaperone ArsD [Salipaludibacillus sp. HK11]|uniref:arsenite efflux transporter metallochaperone ArsD n=1 Tax=Salipaludibacillus sp. HK11 TaxID=3394320 RepID=UPI0039FDB076
MSTKIEIFDPALCCATGVCGPSVDPELTRISRTIMKLVNEGYDVSRYNLAQEAEYFAEHKGVTRLLEEEGPDGLPATVVDGELVLHGRYPSLSEFAEWFEFNEEDLKVNLPKRTIELRSN